jgi:thioredoxin 2
VEVTDANFPEMVLSSPLPVLLDLWAPWCGPCRTVGPIIEELSAKYQGRLRTGKMNVDDNPYTSRELGVSSIPTLLFYKGGHEVNRLVGAHPKGTIEQYLKMIL